MKYEDRREVPDGYSASEPRVKIFSAEQTTNENAHECDRGYSSRHSTTAWSDISEDVNEWITDHFADIRILSIEYVGHSVMIVYHELFEDEEYVDSEGEHHE